MFWNQIRTGTLPAGIQALLYHYRYGKPADVVQVEKVEHHEDLSEMSADELAEQAVRLSAAIRAGEAIAVIEEREAEQARLASLAGQEAMKEPSPSGSTH